MANVTVERATLIRERTRCWLSAALADQIKVSALAGDIYGFDGDRKAIGRATINAFRRGTRTPTPAVIWRVGEGLRTLGSWANGAVALYAAGHNAALIALLSQLAQAGASGTRAALDLYAALPLAVEVEIDAMLAGMTLENELLAFEVAHDGRALRVAEARAFIKRSFANLEPHVIKTVSSRALSRQPMAGIRSAAARVAFKTVSSPLAPDRARDAAWFMLEEWEAEWREPLPDAARQWSSGDFRTWRSQTATVLDRESERRVDEARDARRTPAEREATVAFSKNSKEKLKAATR